MSSDVRRAICVIANASEIHGSRAPTLRKLQSRCEDAGWTLHPAIPVKTVASREGRPVDLLEPRSAGELYRFCHRELVHVIISRETTPRVCLDPRQHPRPSNHALARLAEILPYKSAISHLDEVTDMDGALQPLSWWEEKFATAQSRSIHLHDYRDPRCLPFQAFTSEAVQGLDLDCKSDRTSFESKHGRPMKRKSDDFFVWALDPRAFHGRDELLARGVPIGRGVHWDVNGYRGVKELRTLTEVWALKERQYLNVYPDMVIRSASNNGGRRIWPDR